MPDYDDHEWLASAQPLQMGADGDLTADAWYRATIIAPTAGKYTLHATGGGDRAIAFVDGARAGSGSLHGGDLPLTLLAGQHTLAIFTAHDGRRQDVRLHRPDLDTDDPKGLMGPAVHPQWPRHRRELTAWRVLKAAGADAITQGIPAPDAAGWQHYKVGQDAFGQQPGFAWFQATTPGGADRAARLAALRERGRQRRRSS